MYSFPCAIQITAHHRSGHACSRIIMMSCRHTTAASPATGREGIGGGASPPAVLISPEKHRGGAHMATYVLLHGAYQGGWIWQRVTPHLRAAGHTVLAPTLDGCAERRHALRPGITTETQAAEISELLFFEDLRDIVLVGTSCGGMVATRV